MPDDQSIAERYLPSYTQEQLLMLSTKALLPHPNTSYL
jgi:hypothetical protein